MVGFNNLWFYLLKPGPPPPQVLETETLKKLLKGLLERVEAQLHPSKGSAATNSLTTGEGPHNIETDAHHCILHGLWLSTAAGAAIEMIPDQLDRHMEIHTKIFDLPDNPYPPLITSQWTGKGIISQESPTTLTVVFQEHIEGAHENHVILFLFYGLIFNLNTVILLQLLSTISASEMKAIYEARSLN